MQDDTINHGADCFLEVLCQTLQQVDRICKERNKAFPKHLVLQCDNTVAQAKNNATALFCAWLVQAHKFATVDLLTYLMQFQYRNSSPTFMSW